MTIIIKTTNWLLLRIVNLFKQLGEAEVEASENQAQDLANFEAFKKNFRSAVKEMRAEPKTKGETQRKRLTALEEIAKIEAELKAEGYE